MAIGRRWAGIDLGAERVSICVTDDLGSALMECDVEAEPEPIYKAIKTAVRAKRLETVGVEAGANAYLVRKLRTLGLPIVVLEARKASKVLALRRNKTDANDARGLADIVRLGGNTVSRVHEKSEESQRIRMQLTIRQHVIKQRVAIENLITSLIRENGGKLKRSTSLAALRINMTSALLDLPDDHLGELRDYIVPLQKLCEHLRAYEEETDSRLKTIAKHHPVCRRFLEVPGIGPIAALSFYSAVDDPHRFTRTEDVASFLGLTPRIRESGERGDRPRISKMGNALTRSHLTISAQTILTVCKKESTLRRQALTLKTRLGLKKARIATARKLSIVLLSLWKSGSDYRWDSERSVQGHKG